MRRLHKSARRYAPRVDFQQVLDFCDHAGGRMVFVKLPGITDVADNAVYSAALRDAYVAACIEGCATTVITRDGTVKHVANEEVFK